MRPMIRNIIGWAQLVALGGIAWGCSSSNSSGGAAACSAAAPCGGTVDGTWTLDSVCVEGNLVAAMNATSGLPAACSSLFQSATLSGSGTVTFANGTETDNITQNMTATAVYTPACASAAAGATVTLSASVCSTLQSTMAGQSGVSSASCSFSSGNCNCSLVYQTVNATSQSYSVSGSTITFTNGDNPIDYCVSGATLTASQVQTNLNGVTLVSKLHKSG